MKSRLFLATLLLGITISTGTAVAHASTELIVNGDFATRSTFGWTVVGDVRVVPFSHSSIFSVQLGSKTNTGQISQSFTISAGSNPTLSFWYFGVPGDEGTTALVATLLDQHGTIISQWDGTIDARWHQATFNINPKYDNSTLTLRFFGKADLIHDVEETWCPPMPLPCRHRVFIYPVFAYVSDVSVTYS